MTEGVEEITVDVTTPEPGGEKPNKAHRTYRVTSSKPSSSRGSHSSQSDASGKHKMSDTSDTRRGEGKKLVKEEKLASRQGSDVQHYHQHWGDKKSDLWRQSTVPLTAEEKALLMAESADMKPTVHDDDNVSSPSYSRIAAQSEKSKKASTYLSPARTTPRTASPSKQPKVFNVFNPAASTVHSSGRSAGHSYETAKNTSSPIRTMGTDTEEDTPRVRTQISTQTEHVRPYHDSKEGGYDDEDRIEARSRRQHISFSDGLAEDRSATPEGGSGRRAAAVDKSLKESDELLKQYEEVIIAQKAQRRHYGKQHSSPAEVSSTSEAYYQEEEEEEVRGVVKLEREEREDICAEETRDYSRLALQEFLSYQEVQEGEGGKGGAREKESPLSEDLSSAAINSKSAITGGTVGGTRTTGRARAQTDTFAQRFHLQRVTNEEGEERRGLHREESTSRSLISTQQLLEFTQLLKYSPERKRKQEDDENRPAVRGTSQQRQPSPEQLNDRSFSQLRQVELEERFEVAKEENDTRRSLAQSMIRQREDVEKQKRDSTTKVSSESKEKEMTAAPSRYQLEQRQSVGKEEERERSGCMEDEQYSRSVLNQLHENIQLLKQTDTTKKEPATSSKTPAKAPSTRPTSSTSLPTDRASPLSSPPSKREDSSAPATQQDQVATPSPKRPPPPAKPSPKRTRPSSNTLPPSSKPPMVMGKLSGNRRSETAATSGTDTVSLHTETLQQGELGWRFEIVQDESEARRTLTYSMQGERSAISQREAETSARGRLQNQSGATKDSQLSSAASTQKEEAQKHAQENFYQLRQHEMEGRFEIAQEEDNERRAVRKQMHAREDQIHIDKRKRRELCDEEEKRRDTVKEDESHARGVLSQLKDILRQSGANSSTNQSSNLSSEVPVTPAVAPTKTRQRVRSDSSPVRPTDTRTFEDVTPASTSARKSVPTTLNPTGGTATPPPAAAGSKTPPPSSSSDLQEGKGGTTTPPPAAAAESRPSDSAVKSELDDSGMSKQQQPSKKEAGDGSPSKKPPPPAKLSPNRARPYSQTLPPGIRPPSKYADTPTQKRADERPSETEAEHQVPSEDEASKQQQQQLKNDSRDGTPSKKPPPPAKPSPKRARPHSQTLPPGIRPPSKYAGTPTQKRADERPSETEAEHQVPVEDGASKQQQQQLKNDSRDGTPSKKPPPPAKPSPKRARPHSQTLPPGTRPPERLSLSEGGTPAGNTGSSCGDKKTDGTSSPSTASEGKSQQDPEPSSAQPAASSPPPASSDQTASDPSHQPLSDTPPSKRTRPPSKTLPLRKGPPGQFDVNSETPSRTDQHQEDPAAGGHSPLDPSAPSNEATAPASQPPQKEPPKTSESGQGGATSSGAQQPSQATPGRPPPPKKSSPKRFQSPTKLAPPKKPFSTPGSSTNTGDGAMTTPSFSTVQGKSSPPRPPPSRPVAPTPDAKGGPFASSGTPKKILAPPPPPSKRPPPASLSQSQNLVGTTTIAAEGDGGTDLNAQDSSMEFIGVTRAEMVRGRIRGGVKSLYTQLDEIKTLEKEFAEETKTGIPSHELSSEADLHIWRTELSNALCRTMELSRSSASILHQLTPLYPDLVIKSLPHAFNLSTAFGELMGAMEDELAMLEGQLRTQKLSLATREQCEVLWTSYALHNEYGHPAEVEDTRYSPGSAARSHDRFQRNANHVFAILEQRVREVEENCMKFYSRCRFIELCIDVLRHFAEWFPRVTIERKKFMPLLADVIVELKQRLEGNAPPGTLFSEPLATVSSLGEVGSLGGFDRRLQRTSKIRKITLGRIREGDIPVQSGLTPSGEAMEKAMRYLQAKSIADGCEAQRGEGVDSQGQRPLPYSGEFVAREAVAAERGGRLGGSSKKISFRPLPSGANNSNDTGYFSPQPQEQNTSSASMLSKSSDASPGRPLPSNIPKHSLIDSSDVPLPPVPHSIATPGSASTSLDEKRLEEAVLDAQWELSRVAEDYFLMSRELIEGALQIFAIRETLGVGNSNSSVHQTHGTYSGMIVNDEFVARLASENAELRQSIEQNHIVVQRKKKILSELKADMKLIEEEHARKKVDVSAPMPLSVISCGPIVQQKRQFLRMCRALEGSNAVCRRLVVLYGNTSHHKMQSSRDGGDRGGPRLLRNTFTSSRNDTTAAPFAFSSRLEAGMFYLKKVQFPYERVKEILAGIRKHEEELNSGAEDARRKLDLEDSQLY